MLNPSLIKLLNVLLSPLVCSPPELPTAAPVHLVREPVRPAAADRGGQVPGGPRRGRGPALPGPALLVRPLQQGTSVTPGPLQPPRVCLVCVSEPVKQRKLYFSKMSGSQSWVHVIKVTYLL